MINKRRDCITGLPLPQVVVKAILLFLTFSQNLEICLIYQVHSVPCVNLSDMRL